ncbi:MAG: hypothetical protein VX837_03245, partial [Candidatus Thermoplasmatota archaeon]|nr:hypothetical protein [Candidatus Thermoplasmatota archaeon]
NASRALSSSILACTAVIRANLGDTPLTHGQLRAMFAQKTRLHRDWEPRSVVLAGSQQALRRMKDACPSMKLLGTVLLCPSMKLLKPLI